MPSVSLTFVDAVTIIPGTFVYDPPESDRVKILDNSFSKDLYVQTIVANNILVNKYVGRFYVFLVTDTGASILLFTRSVYSGKLFSKLSFPDEYNGLNLSVYFLVREYTSTVTFNFYELNPVIVTTNIDIPVTATAGDTVGHINTLGMSSDVTYSLFSADSDNDGVPALGVTDTGSVVVRDVDDAQVIGDFTISATDFDGENISTNVSITR